MSFYFPIPETVTKSKIVYDCSKCKLRERDICSPDMEPIVGDKYDGIVIVGQCPSETDDQRGKILVDEKDKVIRSTAMKNQINVIKHAAVLHAVSCFPGMKNGEVKKPTETQFRCCRERLANRLNELKPKIIICCGEMAFKYIMGLKVKYAASRIRNRIVPNYEFNCLVFPILNPQEARSYVYIDAIKRDLTRIFKLYNQKFHRRTEINKKLKDCKILENISITEITTFNEAKNILHLIKQTKEIAFDYETTNASPYDDDFEIIYFAFGNATTAWVFHEDLWKDKPMVWAYIKRELKRILTNKAILKIIQNSKFEDLSSRYRLGIKKIENVFCTMVATHTVDERRGCTSQDFQNLVRFGIPPYSEEIKKYIETTKEQKVNRIREAPKASMIQYNGLDVITCFNNYIVLDDVLLDSYPAARDNYEFLMRGHEKFANFSQRGIMIGELEFDELETLINSELINTIEEIKTLPEVVSYNEFLDNKVMNAKKAEKTIKAISKKGTTNDNTTGKRKKLNGGRRNKSLPGIRRKISY